MSDLISKEDVIEAVCKLQKYDLDERNRLRIYAPWHGAKRIFVETEAIYKTIYTLPSADAVDVNDVTIHYKPYPSANAVQGEWINSKTKGYVVCSNCNKLTTNINRKKYNYCPYCGARMKGGDDE